MRKTKSGVTLTSKNDEDNRLLDEAIRNNEKLKDNVILRRPAKIKPKIIIYNVTKDTTVEELKSTLESQKGVSNVDVKILFKMERERTGIIWSWTHIQKPSSI